MQELFNFCIIIATRAEVFGGAPLLKRLPMPIWSARLVYGNVTRVVKGLRSEVHGVINLDG